LQPSIFEVPDATADARFVDNPLVAGGPGIRFYAGIPLVTSGGTALGTLCVIDRKPRKLSPKQRRQLALLADSVRGLIERRVRPSELAALVQAQELHGEAYARIRQWRDDTRARALRAGSAA
jgi:GAF domain-containing protein